MKTLLRNSVSMIRKFRIATFLNVAGLSVAFAVALVLMMQVAYEFGYDRFHRDADRLFRLELYNEEGGQSVVNRPLAEVFKAFSPQVEAMALVNPFMNASQDIQVEREGRRFTFEELCYTVDPSFSRVFHLDMVEGEASALDSPDRVLIPESMARRFFGDTPAVGRPLQSDSWQAVVGGVYKDWPENTIFGNVIYRHQSMKAGAGDWMQNSFECYVLLDRRASAAEVVSHFESLFTEKEKIYGRTVRLVPIYDVHFERDMVYETQTDKGNRELLWVLSGIAFLILVIAAINFTNFSNALVPMRLRSINTQKVLGESDVKLRLSLIFEATVISFISYLIAVWLVQCLAEAGFEGLVMSRVLQHLPVGWWMAGGGVALLLGIVAGCWPAFYITSFPPALVLKGSFGLSPKGRFFRNVLVGVQYMASFVLIIAALFILLQNKYMLHRPLGFDKERILVAELNRELQNRSELVKQQLNALIEVEVAAQTSDVIGSLDNQAQMGRMYKEQQVLYSYIYADPDLLKVLQIDDKSQMIPEQTSESLVLFNETARKKYQMSAGEMIRFEEGGKVYLSEKIVGFVPDIAYNSCYATVEPWAIYLTSGNNRKQPYVMIRMQPGVDPVEARASVVQKLKDLSPGYQPKVYYYNDMQEKIYQKEIQLGRQISFFSLMAVFISLIGVWGVILFESEYRKKEISIRRVFGATVREIWQVFGTVYIRIATLCFVLAVPFAWYAVQRWQEVFVYKVALSWWIYMLAFMLVCALTMATVSIQNWRMARVNPVDSLKGE